MGIEIASNERSRDEYAPPARTALTSASEGDSLPPSCACEPFKNHARQSVIRSVAEVKSPSATRRHIVFRSFPRRRRTRTRANDETHRGDINQFVGIPSAPLERGRTTDAHPRASIHPSIHPSIHRASPRDDEARRSSRVSDDDEKEVAEDVPRGRRQRISSFFISSCLCGEFVAEEANVPALASGSRSKRCAHKRRSRARRRSVFSLFLGNTNVKVFETIQILGL